MSRLVFDEKYRVADWVWPRINREAPFDRFYAIGVEADDGSLIAGVVFDGFVTGARCSMQCAGEGSRWCSRELLWHCFNYVFNRCAVKTVVNLVRADNAASIRFTQHVGFKEIGRIRDGAGDCDLIIYQLHKDDCRWI